MAFPQTAAPTVTNFINATSHLVTMPPTVNAGDLLLTFLSNDSGATITLPSGWTSLATGIGGGANRVSIYYKIADGTEDGTTVDFVTSASETMAAQVYRVTAWHGTTPPEAGTIAAGSSTTPDPPALSPSWGAEDTLWFAVVGTDAGSTASAYPTNYTDGVTATSGGAGACGIASARRELNATSDNPATFTITSAPWLAETIAVRPAAGGTPVDVDAAIILPAIVVTSVVDLTVTVAGAVLLPALDVDASVDLTVEVQGAVMLPALVVSADIESALSVAGAILLPALTVAAAIDQSITVEAGGASGAYSSGYSSGYEIGSGAGGIVLPALVVAAEVEVETAFVEVDGAILLPVLTVAADIDLSIEVDGAINLPALDVDADVDLTVEVNGAVTLPALVIAGNVFTGDGVAVNAAILLPALIAAAEISATVEVQGDVDLPALTVAGNVLIGNAVTVNADILLPNLDVAGSVQLTVEVNGDIDLPPLIVGAEVDVEVPVLTVNAAIVLPALRVSGILHLGEFRNLQWGFGHAISRAATGRPLARVTAGKARQ